MFTYKKLKASDVSITPFEAHKQYSYNFSSTGSNGILFTSGAWSNQNPAYFSQSNLDYFQIDKMFYRDYIVDHGNLIADVDYLEQERRLYDKANIISITQKSFGGRIHPGSFNLTSGYTTLRQIKDDGKGNLYPSNYTLSTTEWPAEESRVAYIAPLKGFKKKDLRTDYETGLPIVNFSSSYLQENIYDDSYYLNQVDYNRVTFSGDTPLTFINTGEDGYLRLDHSDTYNFGYNQDFNISFYFEVTQNDIDNIGDFDDSIHYFIAKADIKTVVPSAKEGKSEIISTFTSGNMQLIDVPAEKKYPFKVYHTTFTGESKLFFERSNGSSIAAVTASLYDLTNSAGDIIHVSVQKTSNLLEIYIDGVKVATGNDISPSECKDQPPTNQANLYIGSRGGVDSFLDSNLSQSMIWNGALSLTQIQNISESITGTPYVGNIFYDEGFAVITHPSYVDGLYNEVISNGYDFSFQNSHLIFEHEYQCTVDENEYNFTQNVSVRKNKSNQSAEVADCTTGSIDNNQITLFKPYMTTVGLYDDSYNLLAVGKVAQPVKMSEETDMTFVLRWDS